ncbi:MAG: STAS domain-containing protein [Lachnospiraceae bacterium]|nr:STAS domain-containing protein [Lachnospiraceae bacterium]
MLHIEEIVREQDVIIKASGRVDTNTAPELERAILAGFQKKKCVRLDLEKVPYVSSAGLRALLIGHKTGLSKGGSMELYHTDMQVMNVFKVTGFQSIFRIHDPGEAIES